MTVHRDDYSALDVLGPYRGPCGLCGGDDARHRVADAVVELVQAGEPIEFVAETYDLTPWKIETLLHHYR